MFLYSRGAQGQIQFCDAPISPIDRVPIKELDRELQSVTSRIKKNKKRESPQGVFSQSNLEGCHWIYWYFFSQLSCTNAKFHKAVYR